MVVKVLEVILEVFWVVEDGFIKVDGFNHLVLCLS